MTYTQQKESFLGYEIGFTNSSYNCPRLKLFGYMSEASIKLAIRKALKKDVLDRVSRAARLLANRQEEAAKRTCDAIPPAAWTVFEAGMGGDCKTAWERAQRMAALLIGSGLHQ